MIKTKIAMLMIVLLSGCATALMPESYTPTSPNDFKTQAKIDSDQSLSQSEKIAKMKDWWSQFNDPVLLELINNAQNNNSSIAAAIVNLRNYETVLVSTRARSIPNLGLNTSSSRGVAQPRLPAVTTNQISLQSSWELDLFGATALATDASQLQIRGAEAQWHEARTLVAAEVARSYFNYHFCMSNKNVLERDYQSRLKQNEITDLNVKVGFEAPASLFSSEASLAQAQNNIVTQEAQCMTEIKALVALTAIDEDSLNSKLKEDKSNLQSLIEKRTLGLYMPISVPGELITQRPDVFNAYQQLQIAAYNVAGARTEKLPRISISGNISKIFTNSVSSSGWNIGPLTISLPIFDGGVANANERLALEKYEQSKVDFASELRNAIKEIETALINLDATEQKTLLNQKSVNGYQKAYEANLAKYQAGLASLFELEDSRRAYLASLNTQIANDNGRLNAWIDLYKALGGGFEKENLGQKNIKIEVINE